MSAARALPAAFLRGAHQIVSAVTAAARHTEAAASDRHAGLRGDPLSPAVVSIVELIRPAGAARGPDGAPMTPETVPVLAPGELTPAQVRDRAGMVGTVLVLMLVVGAALGVLWAWIGGAL